jgi:predicted membrane-bound mannosyltransferase
LTLHRSLLQDSVKETVLAGLLVALIAMVVSAAFFSSFGRNPRGVIDSFTTYAHYIDRATGQGTAGRHDHPADYYFLVLFWWKHGRGPIWSELAIAAFALAGLAAAALGRGLAPRHVPLARFLAIFTVVTTAVYSLISYKTPWCAIGLLHGMILLAGVGMTVLIRITPSSTLKCVVFSVMAAAVGHLAWQSWQAGLVACDDPDNPYVYAHATGDVPALADRLAEVASADPNHDEVGIQVICPDDDYWPLPWYLRDLQYVGWFSELPAGMPAQVIVIQAQLEPALIKKLYEEAPPGQRYLYMPLTQSGESRDWLLRPHVPLRAYVRSDLWEHYRRAAKSSG